MEDIENIKMGRVLSVEEMLPPHFEPNRTYHFLFKLMGIDSFLIKRMTESPWTVANHINTITIELYDAHAPSTSQQILVFKQNITGENGEKEQLETSSVATMELLNPVGCVVSKVNFKDLSLLEVHYPECNYTTTKETQLRVYKIVLGYKIREQEF